MSDQRDIRYRKIKIAKNGKVHLVYDEPVQGGGWDKHAVTYTDQPLPKFQKALNKMAEHLVEICQIESGYAKDMIVMGVTISYTDAGVMGLSIIAKKVLANKLVVPINSPHLPEQSHSDDAAEFPILSEACISALGKVIGQAEGYRLGDRAQLGMFPGDGDQKTPVDADQEAS